MIQKENFLNIYADQFLFLHNSYFPRKQIIYRNLTIFQMHEQSLLI